MYHIKSELHKVEGVISPKWARGITTNIERFNNDNKDYRRLDDDPLRIPTIIVGLGGITVAHTRMEFTSRNIRRVDGIGLAIDATLGEEPFRLVEHGDLLDAAIKDRTSVGEDIQDLFSYPSQNDTWLFPSSAIDIS